MKYNDLYKYTKDMNILYVEDEENLRNELENILLVLFKNVVTAIDGEDGFNKYMEHTKDDKDYFDIVFTDINMPNVDGTELIKKIQDLNNKQVVVVISAYNESNRLINLINLGITNFIHKPFSRQQFVEVFVKASTNVISEKEKKQFAIEKENFLKMKIENATKQNKEQQKLLVEQSKMAAMGEMIDAIAHQWRQPLNIIKMNTDVLTYYVDENKNLSNKELVTFQKNIFNQTKHMDNTLKEFRNFLRPNKEQYKFDVEKSINSVLILIKDHLIKETIQTKVIVNEKITLLGVENEFKHVLLNLINNAKDAFIENKITTRKINIVLDKIAEKNIISISDNAGGVPNDVIDHIFEYNFTTKQKDKGTGIGLYMSKQIIDKLQGTLSCTNTSNGACFSIVI